MRLYVDKNIIIQEFKKTFIEELKKSESRLKSEIESKFATGIGRKRGEISIEDIRDLNNKIIASISANTEALMDNYGTGSKMDLSNPLLSEYIASDAWNRYRSRSDTTIRGRDAGSYTNVFGEIVESSGAFAGQVLENRKIKSENGGYIEIKPQDPSHAIEEGMKWYMQDWLPIIFNNAVNNTNFLKGFIYK